MKHGKEFTVRLSRLLSFLFFAAAASAAPLTLSFTFDTIGPAFAGIAPGTLYSSVLYDGTFAGSDTPDNAFVLTPRVNFTGNSSAGDIYGEWAEILVVPEPGCGLMLAVALLALALRR